MPELFEELPDYVTVMIRVAAVLVAAFVLNRIVRLVIGRTRRRMELGSVDASNAVEQKRMQTVVGVLRAGATFVVWAVALMVAVGQTGLDIGPLIAAAGIGGVALGFGAQSLVKDVISGFFILFEDQYHVGDVVQVAGVSGMVEAISLHSTVLRDLDGRRHTVPNGEITVSTNYTSGFSRYLMDLPVPYDADIDHVTRIVEEATEQLRSEPGFAEHMRGPLVVLGVEAYEASEVLLRAYVETAPGKQWIVGRELRKRIKLAYDAAGVSIPFPHREVILRTEQPAGESP